MPAPLARLVPVEADREPAGGLHLLQEGLDLGGVHLRRRHTGEAEDHRLVGVVPDAGEGERSTELHAHTCNPVQQALNHQCLGEAPASNQRADGVAAGWADADLEQLEGRRVDGVEHCGGCLAHELLWGRGPLRCTTAAAAATLRRGLLVRSGCAPCRGRETNGLRSGAFGSALVATLSAAARRVVLDVRWGGRRHSWKTNLGRE
mmetsp:Transcript_100190/g.321293  ORF Transcript_100190/g.321293 Transcript_100190/m.321293 type:complete len:205 (+) Transcript_100190:1611-2225(+)